MLTSNFFSGDNMFALNSKLRQVACALLLICLAGGTEPLRGDLIIEIGSTALQAGSAGSVDVWVSSNAAATFSLANYAFRIDEISQIGGELNFLPGTNTPAALKQNNQEQLDADYLFFGRSAPQNFFAIRQDPNRLQLVGGDESTTGNITINPTTPFLLARLELQHITPTPNTANGTFRVTLIENPSLTYFQNLALDDNDPLQPKIASNSYSLANSGLVTVVSVPEPNLGFLSPILFVGLHLRRVHRRGA